MTIKQAILGERLSGYEKPMICSGTRGFSSG